MWHRLPRSGSSLQVPDRSLLAVHFDYRSRNLIQQDRRIKEFHPNQFAECDHVAPILANFPSKTCPDTLARPLLKRMASALRAKCEAPDRTAPPQPSSLNPLTRGLARRCRSGSGKRCRGKNATPAITVGTTALAMTAVTKKEYCS